MPREDFGKNHQFLKRGDVLSFEEIERSVRLLSSFGPLKIRLTGGEPLLRKELPTLVGALARIDGVTDLALTSNGVLLTDKTARALADAGLQRITVSLDSLDEKTFHAITDSKATPKDVLAGIEVADKTGLQIKVNAVIKKGVNDKDIVPLARHFHGTGIIMRFIEFMDVGSTNHWRSDEVLSASDMIERIHAELPLVPLEANYPGEVATRWAYRDGGGEVGFIASITQPFCADCTRLRLSADGSLYTCLFATSGHDLRAILRNGDSDDEIKDWLADVWHNRTDRYSELRAAGQDPHKEQLLKRIEMSYIGG